MAVQQPRTVRVALAGNPNCGKTSLFNALTGGHQHVGNYPGVTVEKKTGIARIDSMELHITDLPGLYSLSSYSPEERISQDELLARTHDVVVVVVDSTLLKRSLVLLAQVMQMGANPVLCLNMADEAAKAGQKIDLRLMAKLLGFPVVETVGHKAQGVADLVAAIRQASEHPVAQHRLVLGRDLDLAIAGVKHFLAGSSFKPEVHDWVATRLLTADETISAVASESAAGQKAVGEARRQREAIQLRYRNDISLFVTSHYFGFVDGLLREVLTQEARADARALSNSIDSILMNGKAGLPIFALLMFGVFWITFALGEFPMAWIESGFVSLAGAIDTVFAGDESSILRSLLVDGIIGGVGGVIVFVPNIMLLYLGLSILEDSGYMARAAFLMDRVMHKFGLHGKSFLPMLTGFGCTIPALMATRTLENEKDRITTMLVLPLMSCGARLPIWLLLIPAFFPDSWRAPVLWAVYSSGILTAFGLAWLLRKTLLAGDDAPFVMELPPYRLPTLRSVLMKMVERAWLYLRKAGTTILAISVVMWFLTAFPRSQDSNPTEAGIETQIQDQQASPNTGLGGAEGTYAARLGQFLEPIVEPLGFDWRIATGLVGAFVAKEVFVSQMGIMYSLDDAGEDNGVLRDAMSSTYSPLTGVSLIVFLLVGTPCMATVVVTRRESGRWKWAIIQFFGLTMLAYIMSLVIFQVGSLVV